MNYSFKTHKHKLSVTLNFDRSIEDKIALASLTMPVYKLNTDKELEIVRSNITSFMNNLVMLSTVTQYTENTKNPSCVDIELIYTYLGKRTKESRTQFISNTLSPGIIFKEFNTDITNKILSDLKSSFESIDYTFYMSTVKAMLYDGVEL